jgi:hypothetical protein
VVNARPKPRLRQVPVCRRQSDSMASGNAPDTPSEQR